MPVQAVFEVAVMIAEAGRLSAGLSACALALIVLPPSAARRRFADWRGRTRPARKPPAEWVIRGCLAVVVLSAGLIATGAVVAAAMVAGTWYARRLRASRDRVRVAAVAQLLEGLEAVIGELRIGAHPSAAAEVAADETHGVVARAFAGSSARSRLGGSGADGFEIPESIVTQELSRVAAAWRVAERHGLALAELLAVARLDLLCRKRFRDRTRAALAGARTTATVLALLPLLGIGLGQLMGASPLSVLFASAAGAVLLPLGAAFGCAGLLWSDAITRKVLR